MAGTIAELLGDIMIRLKQTGRQDRLSRRDFLKIMAAAGAGTWATAGFMPGIPPLYAAGIQPRRGGVVKVAGEIRAISHPAADDTISSSNLVRQIAQCLTVTNTDNKVNPLLLETLESHDDLRTWTLTLKKDIRFNNGDRLSSDDVAFTIRQWLALPLSSPMRRIFGRYLSPEGIETVTDLKLRLLLDQPMVDLPAAFSHPCAVILNHRTFEGDFLKAPHGTGPFRMTAFRAGERCVLKRRAHYWEPGGDQSPLPYVDQVEFIHVGLTPSEQAAALDSGQVDIIDVGDAEGTEAELVMMRNPHIRVHKTPSGRTHLLCIPADQRPWRDNRVRLALKICQDREKILSSAFLGEGQIGMDFHVSPVHPEHCKRPAPEYQPDRAGALLQQAGYDNGLDAVIKVNPQIKSAVRYAEILRDDALTAGFRLQLEMSEAQSVIADGSTAHLEIIPFPHYPGATTALDLAHNTDPYGFPVHGNVNQWTDADFSELLAQANATEELEERRHIFCRLEDIQQQRGAMGNACWLDAKRYTRAELKGIGAHPGQELDLTRVWIDK